MKKVKAPDGRIWEFAYDGSIRTQVSRSGRRVNANRDYSVEIVSPILTYRKDIDTLQDLFEGYEKPEPLQIHLAAFIFIWTGAHIHQEAYETL